MNLLQQILDKLSNSDEQELRDECTILLRELAGNMDSACEIWNDAKEHAAGEPDQFTFVVWFGADRARALHRLHLEQRCLGAKLTALTEVALSDTMGIVGAIDIVEAYNESQVALGQERIETALKTLTKRRQQLHEIVAALN